MEIAACNRAICRFAALKTIQMRMFGMPALSPIGQPSCKIREVDPDTIAFGNCPILDELKTRNITLNQQTES
jgi:hypothetical protein